MVGLYTGWAAFLCSGLMASAYWMVHGTKALFPDPKRRGTRSIVLLCLLVHLCAGAQVYGAWTPRSVKTRRSAKDDARGVPWITMADRLPE